MSDTPLTTPADARGDRPVVVPANGVVAVPEYLSDEEAAPEPKPKKKAAAETKTGAKSSRETPTKEAPRATAKVKPKSFSFIVKSIINELRKQIDVFIQSNFIH